MPTNSSINNRSLHFITQAIVSLHTPQKTRSLVPVGVPHATPAGFRISCLAPNQTSRCHTHEHTTTRALSPALKSSESRPLKKNNAKRQISPVRLKPSPIPNTPSKARNDWHRRDRMKPTELPKKGRIKATQAKQKKTSRKQNHLIPDDGYPSLSPPLVFAPAKRSHSVLGRSPRSCWRTCGLRCGLTVVVAPAP